MKKNDKKMAKMTNKTINKKMDEKMSIIDSRIINFIYDFGIIDYWDGWTTLFNGNGFAIPIHIKPISMDLFNSFAWFFSKIGDKFDFVRNSNAFYFKFVHAFTTLNPTDEHLILLGIKFDKNGQTLIGSSRKLSKELIEHICIRDVYEDSSHVKCIIPTEE